MSPRLKSALRWLTFVAVVAALVVGAKRLLKRPPLVVHAVKVTRGLVRDVVTSSTAGEIAGDKHATVRAEAGGRVVRKLHDRGDRVKAGDLVLVLDEAEAEARLAQARASLAAARAVIGEAEAKVETLRMQAERARKLSASGAASVQMREDADSALDEAKKALAAQQAQVGPAQAAVEVAQVALDRCRLAAPFDGLLTEVYPDPGEELAPMAPAFEIVDDSKLHVDADIDEADIAKVKVGQQAVFTLDALPGERVPGVVSKIAPAVTKDLKGARTLQIEVQVSDPRSAMARGLKPGMSANVEIVVAEKPDVLQLPSNVIVGRGVNRTVFRVEGGKAVSTKVATGLSNWEYTEILSGVHQGEEIVSSLNTDGLVDGALISVK